MIKTVYNVRIKLIDKLLGTIPKDRNIYKTYIASKSPTPDDFAEAEDVAGTEEKGWTTFLKDDEGLYIMNYMILGFLKESGNFLKEQVKVKNLRSKLENSVFIAPRHIHFGISEVHGCIERPLRGQTAQGQIISLLRSDYINEGWIIDFQITLIRNKEVDADVLKFLFEYGEFKGLGQFRNGSYGRFELVSFEEAK